MPSSSSATQTNTQWGVEFDTVRREKLFRSPPKDRSAFPRLQEAIRPHVESFNAIFENQKLIDAAVQDIGARTFLEPVPETQAGKVVNNGVGQRRSNRLRIKITEVTLEPPKIPDSNKFSLHNRSIWPSECRERHATYRGRLRAKLAFRINNGDWKIVQRDFGALPIMLRSNRCHLRDLPPNKLIQHKEESEEQGGYFIVNGNEKLIRLLIVAKRNYPMAIVRGSFENRGASYSSFGIQIRCVRPDETAQSNVLHYLKDGNITFRFSWKKNEYLVPVMMILKALVETNDREIFEQIVGKEGSEGVKNTFVTERVELLLRNYKSFNLHGMAATRAYLGQKFKLVLDVAPDVSNAYAGIEFLRKIVLVHLGNVAVTESQNRDKSNLLLFMIRKLYAMVAGDCTADNPDAVSNQEILLGGFLYGAILKEKIEEFMDSIRPSLRGYYEKAASAKSFSDPDFAKDFQRAILGRSTENIAGPLEYFMSTGNLASRSGLDLQQTSGYTVVAEKINFYRFMSHFRMVHRGSFFAQLKTTTVRKLLPESWGFLCPVHTPDGSPCGLLNHFAHECKITTEAADASKLPSLLAELGVNALPSAAMDESVCVQLNGRVLGYCTPEKARWVSKALRRWKVEGKNDIPLELEIGYVPNSNGGLYPGVFLTSSPSRMIRAVKYLELGKKDFVGPFEQPYMSIACWEHEIEEGESTHVEIDIRNILSIFANQTPFSDHNQSPRNMYQCQMCKQSMGTPGAATRYRTDNKSYRLQTGQTPIARSPLYNQYGLDNYPNGMNAVVAVISYTGYDMDDGMIINRSALERGFGNGSVYKTKIIRIDEGNTTARKKTSAKALFGFAPNSFIASTTRIKLDNDGLPFIGTQLQEGDPIAASYAVSFDPISGTYINRDGQTQLHKYKDTEPAWVEEVRLMGAETGDMPCQGLSIKIRIERSPIIGDKFSSRHGQKGVLSQKFPSKDMPFSESGIIPDVIINPHAFPSRMTIGMFVESLAGKAGALHGLAQDSRPWRFDEDCPAGEFFGEQLLKAGYNFHGNEPMYSGITGKEFAADIYIGVVFYQRLRHMVNDKFQVRTTGPINPLTGQPIKGRAKGGGIRVGEMERDALLAHGAAYLLQDRLLNCSDYMRAWVCRECGSFLSTQSTVVPGMRKGSKGSGIVRCRRCAKRAGPEASKLEVWEDGAGIRFVGGEDTTVVAVPGVLRYLDVELAAMGIRLRYRIDP
ncbi:DNA-directed RNA polymerase I subunit RPA2 [Thelotrema lepadinum]|nr:DNA-directed RNA polymerase I subunit RPA2 [Thelotrema lepadinum]